MKTPFSSEQFLRVFEHYNATVFPAQILFILAGLAAVWFAASKRRNANGMIAFFLSFLWIWEGLVYHWQFFSQINKAAFLFGILMMVEGILIFFAWFPGRRLSFSIQRGTKGITGIFLIFYGLIAYPLIDLLSGNHFASIISAGLPCPSTIMTFGFFLLVRDRFPMYLLIVPSLWGLLGISAAFQLEVYQDLVMVLSVLPVIIMLWVHNRKITSGTMAVKAV